MAEPKQCYGCENKIKLGAVSVEHRVVGSGIDVTGGPPENYHPECAGKRIEEFRDHLSNTCISENIFRNLAEVYRDVLRRNKIELFGSEVRTVAELYSRYKDLLSPEDYQGSDPTENI